MLVTGLPVPEQLDLGRVGDFPLFLPAGYGVGWYACVPHITSVMLLLRGL